MSYGFEGLERDQVAMTKPVHHSANVESTPESDRSELFYQPSISVNIGPKLHQTSSLHLPPFPATSRSLCSCKR